MMTATVSRTVMFCALACLAAACGLQKAPQAAGHQRAPASGGAGAVGRGRHDRSAGAPAGSGTPQAALAPCSITAVRVRLDTPAAGVAAGTSYLPLDFTNQGPRSCRLSGFPQVTFASAASDRAAGTAGVLDRGASAQSMTLAAGQTAHIWLRLADAANLPARQCDPVTAAGLRVGLPGAPQTAFVAHRLLTCGKPVTGTDMLTVEPFRPGTARPGSAQ